MGRGPAKITPSFSKPHGGETGAQEWKWTHLWWRPAVNGRGKEMIVARGRRRLGLLAALVGLTVAVAACGSSAMAPSSSTPTVLGSAEGTVSVLAGPGHVEDGSNNRSVNWVQPFSQQTGWQVEFTSFGTSDEAVAKMRSGQFDVVSASGDASLRLIAAGDVAPINTALLSNYPNIYPYLREKSWNSAGGKVYGVPSGWGANLLMYRTDLVKPAPTSWSAVFDDADRYPGKVTAYDSPIYLADAALYLMKHRPELRITNPYALDEQQFQAVVDLLKIQRASIGFYWNDIVHEVLAFSAGWSVIGTTWQVGANLARDGGAQVETVTPVEGSTGWADSWMVSSRAKHLSCAYQWINYALSPTVNAQITEYVGEAPANSKACAHSKDRNHCAVYHSADAAYASKIWYWATPMADCLDGRTDVKCVDYAGWTKAWLEIKG
ncbi:MAG: ABC transporter substrate-binding protein [Gordonia sp. (in: high G+C Gram-positive bacteria)]